MIEQPCLEHRSTCYQFAAEIDAACIGNWTRIHPRATDFHFIDLTKVQNQTVSKTGTVFCDWKAMIPKGQNQPFSLTVTRNLSVTEGSITLAGILKANIARERQLMHEYADFREQTERGVQPTES